MTDLRDCPCCGGILNVPRHYKLTSACRCGFPTKVTWDDFAELREGKLGLTETISDPFKRDMAA